MAETRIVQTTLRLPERIYITLKEQADSEFRSVSQHINWVLAEHVRQSKGLVIGNR